MALPDHSLTNVVTLREWLTRNAVSQTDGRLSDANLEALIDRASAAVAAWCDRQLVAPSIAETRYHDGDDSRRLVLPEWPVTEFVGLSIDGVAVPERVELLDAGYVVRAPEAWIELVGHTFTRGVQNVAVTARLGYDSTLAQNDARHRRALATLEQACLRLCTHWFEHPAAAEAELDPPADVRGLLAPYRRLGA